MGLAVTAEPGVSASNTLLQNGAERQAGYGWGLTLPSLGPGQQPPTALLDFVAVQLGIMSSAFVELKLRLTRSRWTVCRLAGYGSVEAASLSASQVIGDR